MSSTPTTPVPNHHAGHPGFSGIVGALAGFAMFVGRGSVARLAVDLADVDGADRVVDVGSGPGNAARAAARRGASVAAVDPATVMHGIARRLARRSPRVSWRRGVAEALPVEDDWATVVWSLATVHHWPDLDGGLAEVLRVLRPGGAFLAVERLTTPDATGLASHGWTEAQAEAFVRRCFDAGFAEARVERHRVGRTRRTQLVVRATAPAES